MGAEKATCAGNGEGRSEKEKITFNGGEEIEVPELNNSRKIISLFRHSFLHRPKGLTFDRSIEEKGEVDC